MRYFCDSFFVEHNRISNSPTSGFIPTSMDVHKIRHPFGALVSGQYKFFFFAKLTVRNFCATHRLPRRLLRGRAPDTHQPWYMPRSMTSPPGFWHATRSCAVPWSGAPACRPAHCAASRNAPAGGSAGARSCSTYCKLLDLPNYH